MSHTIRNNYKLIARATGQDAKARRPPSSERQLRVDARENTLIANEEVMQAPGRTREGAPSRLIEAVVNAQIRQFPWPAQTPQIHRQQLLPPHGFAAQLRALQATEARPVAWLAAPRPC